MAARKHLPVLEAGQKYEGYMGFIDGEPNAFEEIGGEHYISEIYFSRRAARLSYEDVRRVTITVESE